jgi:hypothetical protein
MHPIRLLPLLLCLLLAGLQRPLMHPCRTPRGAHSPHRQVCLGGRIHGGSSLQSANMQGQRMCAWSCSTQR